jgi:HPt (histidine-containing phosphotransfer) domain-containing protein
MSAIDLDVLRQLEADLPVADLRTVLETFDNDMQRLGAALTASGRAGDTAGWRRAAHRIAGAAATVGAVVVERHAREAMACTAIDTATAARQATAIDGAITAALAELRHVTTPWSSGG